MGPTNAGSWVVSEGPSGSAVGYDNAAAIDDKDEEEEEEEGVEEQLISESKGTILLTDAPFMSEEKGKVS